jgi:hypothetical protein
MKTDINGLVHIHKSENNSFYTNTYRNNTITVPKLQEKEHKEGCSTMTILQSKHRILE